MNNNNLLTKVSTKEMKYLYLAFSLVAISLSAGFSCDKHGDKGGHIHDHQASGTGTKADLANALANMGARLEMVEDRRIGSSDVTALPEAALISERGKTYILVQSDQDPAKIIRREVTIGKSDGQYVEVKTGVFPGDNVVIQQREVATSQPRSNQYAPSPQYSSRSQYDSRQQYERQPEYTSPRSFRGSEPICNHGSRNESRFIENQPSYNYERGSSFVAGESSCSFGRQSTDQCAGARCATESYQNSGAYGHQSAPAFERAGAYVSELYRDFSPDYQSSYTPQRQQPQSNHSHSGSCNH